MKHFRLIVAGPSCGAVLPDGESEKLGELHSVAKEVWYRVRRDAEAAWDDPNSDCRTWGCTSSLQMAAKFLLSKPYVVYGGRATPTLRTTVIDQRNEPTHTVCQSVKAGTPMDKILTCGLAECRVIIGPNGATIAKCDALNPNVAKLKEDLMTGWNVKPKGGKRLPPVAL